MVIGSVAVKRYVWFVRGVGSVPWQARSRIAAACYEVPVVGSA